MLLRVYLTVLILIVVEDGLVPHRLRQLSTRVMVVLILIVVEDGLVPSNWSSIMTCAIVLILIVVEDGLVLRVLPNLQMMRGSLNPYCSGRWSRTRPYKTFTDYQQVKELY